MRINRLQRREFIAALGGAVAWPVAVTAQQQAMPVIGFLNIGSPQKWVPYLAAFKRGLGQVGYVEGRNVAIEYRWADFQYERLPALAVDLAGRKVAVIAANGGSRSALAAKSATTTIPVVFTFGDGDPVTHGLVKTFNQPGGNVTGVTMIGGVLEPKRLELLREVVPKATVIYMLVNPNNAGVLQDLPEVATAASRLGLGFQAVRAGTESEIDTAFATFIRENARALMVANDAFLQSQSEQITTLTAKHALPTIYPWREYADVGGLMSYGTSIREAYRQSGVYVGQILKGANPAELPVQQPIKVELVINLKTAKALDLEIPMALLMRVDEVIE